MHTFIETWQIVLEEDQWRQTGHPKCLSCSFLTDFDKLDSTFGTVVINLLHYFQQIFGFARLSVIWKTFTFKKKVFKTKKLQKICFDFNFSFFFKNWIFLQIFFFRFFVSENFFRMFFFFIIIDFFFFCFLDFLRKYFCWIWQIFSSRICKKKNFLSKK